MWVEGGVGNALHTLSPGLSMLSRVWGCGKHWRMHSRTDGQTDFLCNYIIRL